MWHRFPEELPPEKKLVLVQLGEDDGCPEAVVAGYLKFAAGDKSCPYFVTVGVSQGRRSIDFWCDCLPEGFQAPAWHFPAGPPAVVAALRGEP